MPSDLSGYFGNKICRWLIGNTMPSAPTALYMALYNGNPKASGSEVTTTIRSGGRLAVSFNALASGVDHELISDADVDFGASEGATPLTHTAIFDASSGGNLISSKAIAGGSQSIAIGTGVKFLAGAVTFNIGSDT